MDTQASSSPVESTQTQPATPSGSKKSLIIAITAIVIAGLALGAYFLLTTQKQEDGDSPPSLTTEGGLKGSFVETKYGFLEYDEKDKVAFKELQKTFLDKQIMESKTVPLSKLKAGVNYVYVPSSLTAKKITELIDPEAKKAFVAYYDASKKKFVTYPKGPFTGTDLLEETGIIPANRGFIIILEKEANVYTIRTSDLPAAKSEQINPEIAGWVLMTLASQEIGNDLAPYKNRLISVWGFDVNGIPQNKIDLAKLATASGNGHFLAWLNLNAGANEGPKEVKVDEPAPVIDSVDPSDIEIPETGAPVITPLYAVKINGSNLKNVVSVTFEDTKITGTITPITNYLAEMKLSIDPSAAGTINMKTFTLKTSSGKEGTGKLYVRYEEILLAPKITGIGSVILIRSDSLNKHYVTITGNNIPAANIQKITFEDINITGSIGASTTTNELNMEIKFDPAKVKPGLKNFSLRVGNKEFKSDVPIIIVADEDSTAPLAQYKYPNINFVSHKQQTIGEPWKTLHVYGTNLNKIEKNYLAIKGYGLLKSAVISVIDSNHLTIDVSNLPVDIAPSDTKLLVKYMNATGDNSGDLSKEKYVEIDFSFSTSGKEPTIYINDVSETQLPSASTTGIIMKGTHIDLDTKVQIVTAENEKVDSKKVKAEVKKITPSKDSEKGEIQIELVASDKAEGQYKFKITNLYGTTYIPFVIFTKPLAT